MFRATSWLHYTTSCNTQSSAPEDGQNNFPKHVELTGIINKPILLHLVGCLYYLYQWSTVKEISDNEIYLLIKYVKSVLWRVVKRLSYIQDARCLKVKQLLKLSCFIPKQKNVGNCWYYILTNLCDLCFRLGLITNSAKRKVFTLGARLTLVFGTSILKHAVSSNIYTGVFLCLLLNHVSL